MEWSMERTFPPKYSIRRPQALCRTKAQRLEKAQILEIILLQRHWPTRSQLEMFTPPTLSGVICYVDVEGRLSGVIDLRILKLRVGLSCSYTNVLKCHASKMESRWPLPVHRGTRPGQSFKTESPAIAPALRMTILIRCLGLQLMKIKR